MQAPLITISTEDFDAAALTATITGGRKDIGALVSFTGYCRDEDNRLQALELEHYPGMAEKQLQRLAEKAAQRWPLQAVVIYHRTGMIMAGEQIVFVACASRHRKDAFEAAEFLMDYLKSDAPFWKKEHPLSAENVDDTRSRWVEVKETDTAMKQRWQKP